MIKTGGTNVSQTEVEMALVQLAGVREAFVFGTPAGDSGHDVAAVVGKRPGAVRMAQARALERLRHLLEERR